MADLEDVDRVEQSALAEQRLDGCLGISGEERAEAAEAQQAHDRGVVDVALEQGSGGIGGGWVPDGQGRLGVDVQDIPGSWLAVGAPRFPARQVEEAGVGRVGVTAAGIEDARDREAAEDVRQPPDVIQVRVGQDHGVDLALPPGERGAEATKGDVRVGPAVDEERRAAGCHDQEPIALADVKHHQVEAAVWLGGDRRQRERHDEAADRSAGAADQTDERYGQASGDSRDAVQKTRSARLDDRTQRDGLGVGFRSAPSAH
jgi:hypothetical protein